jgi:drug/metabolite transporter (DMT)-like permease
VFSLILSVVIWREILDNFSIIGAIIISSGVYISKKQNMNYRKQKVSYPIIHRR